MSVDKSVNRYFQKKIAPQYTSNFLNLNKLCIVKFHLTLTLVGPYGSRSGTGLEGHRDLQFIACLHSDSLPAVCYQLGHAGWVPHFHRCGGGTELPDTHRLYNCCNSELKFLLNVQVVNCRPGSGYELENQKQFQGMIRIVNVEILFNV